MKTTARLDTSVRTALARAIADRDVPDDIVKQVSDHLLTLGEPSPVRKFDICTHGLCVDYLVDHARWPQLVRDVLDLGLPIRGIHGFPWGILEDELLHVSVEVDLEELAGLGR